MSKRNIFFLGCGKMGSAIINNLLKNRVSASSFLVLKPSDENQIQNIRYIHSYSEIPKNYKADIVFCVFKPQMATEILNNFSKQGIFDEDTIFISVLAGKKIAFFEKILGKEVKLIRLMPNLPITIGEGIFAYFCNSNIRESEILPLLDLMGKSVKLEKENLMDMVTAVSGSGPAYLFLFAEMVIKSARKIGLSDDVARQIVLQTIYGSAKMMKDSKEDLDQMIKNVASKGGTTEAALEVFNQDNAMQDIINNAINAAYERSKELSEIF